MKKKTIESLVRLQQARFGIEYDGPPRRLTQQEAEFYFTCLDEEVAEFDQARGIVAEYDALLDIIVFAVGALTRMGLPLQEGLEAVVAANLKKTLGPKEERAMDFELDLCKPPGWVGPEVKLMAIIAARKMVADVNR